MGQHYEQRQNGCFLLYCNKYTKKFENLHVSFFCKLDLEMTWCAVIVRYSY